MLHLATCDKLQRPIGWDLAENRLNWRWHLLCSAASFVGDGNSSGLIHRRLRVFIVDDNEDARDLLETIFSKDGFECRSADSAATAMLVLETYVPDVIISDLQMPDEDGLSLIRRIRTHSRACAAVPAIALTAMDGCHHRQAALDGGFDLYIVKPAHRDALIEAVTRLALASQAQAAC